LNLISSSDSVVVPSGAPFPFVDMLSSRQSSFLGHLSPLSICSSSDYIYREIYYFMCK